MQEAGGYIIRPAIGTLKEMAQIQLRKPFLKPKWVKMYEKIFT